MDRPMSRSWVGFSCNLCDYAILSPDTTEGCRELIYLHMCVDHPQARWLGSDGRIQGGGLK